MKSISEIEAAKSEYLNLSDTEWCKIFFDDASGGYVATHVLKDDDDLTVPGIEAEANTCIKLAKLGKRILRLPENVFDVIDEIFVSGIKYRDLLKFKTNCMEPRGYPDAFFDGQTWDFKKSEHRNTNSVRKLILDGRKADNVVFIIESDDHLDMISEAVRREVGSRKKMGQLDELPNVYCLWGNVLICLWKK